MNNNVLHCLQISTENGLASFDFVWLSLAWLGLQAAYKRVLYVITAINEVYKTIQASAALNGSYKIKNTFCDVTSN